MESTDYALAPNADLVNLYVRENDHVAFAELVRRFGPMVLGMSRRLLAYHEDADDVTQIVFAELARRAGTIEDPAAVAGWLHTITVRVAQRLRQRRSNTKPLITDPVDPRPNLDDLSRRGELEILSEEIENLPESWREPLLLRYFAGLSNEAAALQLGTSVTAFEGRLKRGKGSLRVRLLRRGVGAAAVIALLQPAGVASASGESYWDAVTDSATDLSTDPSMLTFVPAASSTSAFPMITFKGALALGAAAVVIALSSGSGHNTTLNTAGVGFSTVVADDSDSAATDVELAENDSLSQGEGRQPASNGKTEGIGSKPSPNPFNAKESNSDSDADGSEIFMLDSHDGPPGRSNRFHNDWLGIDAAPVQLEDDRRFSGGIQVIDITPGSSAERAGLRKHDIIVTLDLRQPSEEEHLRYIRELTMESEQITILVLRDGQLLSGMLDKAVETSIPKDGPPFRSLPDGYASTHYFPAIDGRLNPGAARLAETSDQTNPFASAPLATEPSPDTDPFADATESNPFGSKPSDPVSPTNMALPRTPLVKESRAETFLRESASLQFIDQPLGDAISFISETYNVPFDVDQNGLEAAGHTPDSIFTAVVSDITMSEGLAIILAEKLGGLDYVIRGKRIVVTSTELAAQELSTRLYDVRGLDPEATIEALTQHPLTSPRGPVGWKTDPPENVLPVPKPAPHESGVVSAVTMETPDGPVVRLLVTQSHRGHEAVQEFLDVLNSQTGSSK